MKAASKVPKTYVGEDVAGSSEQRSAGEIARRGFDCHRRRPPSADARLPAIPTLIKEATNPWYEVTLIEGRNREIRRMFEKVGHHVEKIKRVRATGRSRSMFHPANSAP